MHLYRDIAQERSSGSSAFADTATPVVFIVDNDPSARGALESLVQAKGWRSQAFARAAEFLDYPRVTGACCLLLDVDLPELNGLELQQRVSDRADMPVIFITGDTGVQTIVRAMKAGALEYLTKPFRNEVLLSAVSFALERSHAVLSREAGARAVRDCYASLSGREREVMELVVSGWLNKQIGAALGISEITVKVHRAKVMRKMKAASLPDLVMKARTLGLKNVPTPNGSFFRSLERYAGTRDHLSEAHAVT
jgi:FixJ family two-component response regulator